MSQKKSHKLSILLLSEQTMFSKESKEISRASKKNSSLALEKKKIYICVFATGQTQQSYFYSFRDTQYNSSVIVNIINYMAFTHPCCDRRLNKNKVKQGRRRFLDDVIELSAYCIYIIRDLTI